MKRESIVLDRVDEWEEYITTSAYANNEVTAWTDHMSQERLEIDALILEHRLPRN